MVLARIRRPSRPLAAWVALAASLGACSRVEGPILDKQAVLERQTWWDNRDWDWYRAKIPFFESPDTAIDATYYYRWEVVTKHLTYASSETGYTFTEFIDRPFWSGAYGAISCPLGHQFYEIRWLKDRRIIEDFARYWFETPGAEPRSYSNWYGDAMWATYLVLGDTAFIGAVLPYMERQYEGWMREHYDSTHGMFYWDGLHDGMEVNINSRLTDDEQAGAEGYRPTLNSYMFADAMAISRAAALLGDTAKARRFAERATRLKERVQQELWDPEREFFFHQFAHDELNGIRAKSLTYETGKFAGNPHGRELIGYVPWQFNLPDSGYEAAWRVLMDPRYFFAPFGPTTVERHDPQFLISPRCCVWSGNQWPYATTQTLVALANLLNNYEQDIVTASDYFRLLKRYALLQRMDGRPYIAEAANPDNGSWDGHNTFYHSEHYFHSAYVDLVITGLVGLRPRVDDSLEVNPLAPDEWDYFALDDVEYHGRRISIVWDRDGSRYGRGAGLSVFADGKRIANAPELGRLTAHLGPARRPSRIERPVNFAVNNGGRAYPLVTASYSAPTTPPHYAVDGNYWYHESPPNRWTAAGSGNSTDWIAVDFGVERPVAAVRVYFYDDGEGIRAPQSYDVQYFDGGGWASVPRQSREPETPTGRRSNVISFPAIETSGVRLVLTHRAGASSGLTELEAWGEHELPLPEPESASPNVAFGARGSRPVVTASYTHSGDRVEHVNDIRIAFTRYSRNRWSAYGSPNPRDWLAVDFGEPHRVGTIDLFLYSDGRGIEAPAAYAVEYWNAGRWTPAEIVSRTPGEPQAWARNRVRVAPIETGKLRVVFEHARPAFTGVTEMMVWENGREAVGGGVTRAPFGVMPDGRGVEVFTLSNENGVEVRAITYGAIIVSLRVPDRDGELDDVVLGFDDLEGYLGDSPYFGAVVGRYANRIAKGRFTLDGREYRLAANDGPNHLHGGVRGFDKVVWDGEPFESDSGAGVVFSYLSPDGEEGYPGNLSVRVRYLLTDDDELVVDYSATTDRATPVNLSQHSYFNLAGDGWRDVLDHVLTISASRYTPVDESLIPTGEMAPVAGTPFDFRKPTPIGARIDADHEQLRFGGGYDHNFVLERESDGPIHAARVEEPTSGRVLEIFTTEPGLQFYSGNFLDGSIVGKSGHVYGHRYGFCLEPQHFPDSPNQAAFPSTILRPGYEYRSRTVYRFSR